MSPIIVWFRRDLRLSDHAPLDAAVGRGSVLPLFVFDPALLHHPETAPARVAFMLSCLASLDQDLRQRGGRLLLRTGDPVQVLPQLIRETGARGIYAYTDCERIYGRVRDARLNHILQQEQMRIRWFEPAGSVAELVAYPTYRRRWFRDMRAAMFPTPTRVQVPDEVSSEPLPSLADLGLVADAKPIPAGGTPMARQLLQEFLHHKLTRYYWQLSYPSAEATTGLSPYIKFGVISMRECVQAATALQKNEDHRIRLSCKQLISRLRWGSGFLQRFRYCPQLELRSLYNIFDCEERGFPEDLYQAWQQGLTGFPIVDAAARCLLATGGWKTLNFRSRALYASFLSNLLNIDWRYGALHFMRHLLDGDCPIDHYQWAMQAGVTHCADKTWTRIYTPEQGAVDRCDPEGTFIKTWVPEVAHLPAEQLGVPPSLPGYPSPILNYREARTQRVQRLQQLRQSFQQHPNLIPHLARLPQDLTPFGADRYPCNTTWVTLAESTLFPAALQLSDLSSEQAADLRTWFVAHVEIQPRRQRQRRSRRSQHPEQQLSLFAEGTSE
jgi:deoxyribodipyrimidine photo-lyase